MVPMLRCRLSVALAFALICSPARASDTLKKADNDLLDDIARRSFRYFLKTQIRIPGWRSIAPEPTASQMRNESATG